MRAHKTGLIYTIFAISFFFLLGNAHGADSSSSEPILPDGLVMEETYMPGIGQPVGRVLLTQGRSVIMHADMSRGYWAKKGLPVFKGDIIVTKEKGRIRLRLNDDSILTMTSETRLVIKQSVFKKKKKSRFSFLKLSLGKARFLVSKLAAFRRSDFKVKTPTSVVGVRGSDFIIEADPGRTIVTTLEDTRLEVVSLAYPDVAPTFLEDFKQTTVDKGALPSEPKDVSPEKLEELKREFVITPEAVEPEAPAPTEPGVRPGEKTEPKPMGAEPKSTERAAADVILVPEDALVEPDLSTAVEELKGLEELIDQDAEFLEEIEEDEQEIVAEKPTIQELPSLPGTP